MKPELEQKTSGQENRQLMSFTPGIYTLGDKVYYLAGDGFFHPTYQTREGEWLYSISERYGLEGEKSLEDFTGEIVKRSGFLLNNPRGRFLALAGTALGVAGVGALAWVLNKRFPQIKETSAKEVPQLFPKVTEQKELDAYEGILLDIPLYWQQDPKWKKETLGKNIDSSYNIGGWGCVIASYAMLVSAIGDIENPHTINQRLKEAEGVFAEGDGNFNQGPGEKALNLTRVWISETYKKDPIPEEVLGQVRTHLDQGRPLIAWVNLYDPPTSDYFPHYVSVIGWRLDQTGKYMYIFNDPWTGTKRELSEKEFAQKSIQFRAFVMNVAASDLKSLNEGWDPSQEMNSFSEVIRWKENYRPRVLWLGKQPKVIENLDSGTQRWWEWLQEGNLSYETLWYWHDCALNGIPEEKCTRERYAIAMTPKEYVQAALTVYYYGGTPIWDTLTQKLMETGNSTGPFDDSSTGARGPLQIKDWTMDFFRAYDGVNVQDPLDAMMSASNLLTWSNMIVHRTSQEEYAFNYAGRPCNPPDEKKCQYNGKYDTFMWNNYPGMGHAAWQLSRQLMESWLEFQDGSEFL